MGSTVIACGVLIGRRLRPLKIRFPRLEHPAQCWQQKGQRSQRHGRPAECSSSGRRRTCPSTGAGKFPAMRAACCSMVRRYACFHMRHMYLICSRVLPWPCPEHEENIVMEVSCTVCDFEACQNILQRTSAAMLACNSPEKLAREQDFHLPRFQAVVHRVSTISGFSADS